MMHHLTMHRVISQIKHTLSRRAPVHVLARLLLSIPPKTKIMIGPVTSSTVVERPSLYLESIKLCNTSCSSTRLMLLRDLTISLNISKSLACAVTPTVHWSWGIGNKTLEMLMPFFSSWNRVCISANIFSRTSLPSRHRLHISMSNWLNSCFKSTMPSCPHFVK